MNRFKKISVVVMTICLGIFSLGAIFLEKATYSDSERRVLASFPEVSLENILDGGFSSQFDEYTTDTFPYRDIFRSIKANVVMNIFQQKDNNQLFQVGNHLAKMDPEISPQMIDYATKLFQKVHDQNFPNQKVYFSLIPDKSHYLAKEHFYLSYDVKEMEEMIQEQLPFAEMISIDHLLEADDYYYTDSHWRQNKVVDVAKYIASSMDKTLKDTYTTETLAQDFYGVYYGQAALMKQPDKIEYLVNDTINQLECSGAKAIYDQEKLKGKDAYEFFLSGNQPLVTIKNPLCKDNSRLIVFRDSYACSFVPLLAEAYSEIVLVDLRYIRSEMLNDYVSFDDADILFMYSTSMMNASTALK